MADKLNQTNIVDEIVRYVRLTEESARIDFLIATRQPHDVCAAQNAAQALAELEQQLLDAGIWRWAAEQVIAQCRKP
jgi:hypothetical protein